MLTIITLMAVTSAALLLSGLRQRASVPTTTPPMPTQPDRPAPAASGERAVIDLGDECRRAAEALGIEAGRRLVSIRLAIGGPLPVLADVPAIAGALRAMLAASIEAATCGAVLVSACMHGGRVQVSVLNDAAGASLADMAAVQQVVALHGGTLDVGSTGRGASIVLRMLPGRVPADASAVSEAAPSLPSRADQNAPAYS